MKKLFLVIMVLVTTGLYVRSQTNAPIFRTPPITGIFRTNMIHWDTVAARNQTYPRLLIKQEGGFSDPDSSSQGEMDYFAVYMPSLPMGGTILELSPINTDANGVSGYDILFRDVIKDDYYTVPFTLVLDGNPNHPLGGRNRDYFKGSLSINGQIIWVKISYFNWPQRPTVQLTWGNGSSYGSVGTISDDFSFSIVENPPSTTKIIIRKLVGYSGYEDGFYVLVLAPDEIGLQSTKDFKVWIDGPTPTKIEGYVSVFHLQMEDYKFFRLKR